MLICISQLKKTKLKAFNPSKKTRLIWCRPADSYERPVAFLFIPISSENRDNDDIHVYFNTRDLIKQKQTVEGNIYWCKAGGICCFVEDGVTHKILFDINSYTKTVKDCKKPVSLMRTGMSIKSAVEAIIL